MTLAALADWLADSGLRNLPLEELVDGFSRRLNDAAFRSPARSSA